MTLPDTATEALPGAAQHDLYPSGARCPAKTGAP
jgi:hypothetical protein